MADRYPDYSTIPNRIKDPTMSEQAEVKTKFPLGSEVQLKTIPGFGYNVIAAIKNERSLMALDGSCLAMALVHEIEAYCDVDQAHFIGKASNVLRALGAQDFSEIAAKGLYKAGARFPDAAATSEVSHQQIAAAVADTTRTLLRIHGKQYKVPTDYDRDQYVIDQWHRANPRFVEEVEAAIEIVGIVLLTGALAVREALETIYPHPEDEI